MLLRQAVREKGIVGCAWKRDINNATRVYMANFCSAKTEFPSAKAVRVN